MKRISMFFWLSVMTALCLSSCRDSNDGDGAPFKWKGLTESKTNTVSVPAVGGTVTIECKNYSGFWVVGVNETVSGNTVHYDTQPGEIASGRQAGKWGTVT